MTKAEDKIPDVPLDERGRKLYSADDLAQIRLALARTTRDAVAGERYPDMSGIEL